MTARQKTGIELRELREMCGLTQQQLADEWGVSVDWIRSIETGRRNPRPWMLQNLRNMATGRRAREGDRQ